jgi:hypothetical protein
METKNGLMVPLGQPFTARASPMTTQRVINTSTADRAMKSLEEFRNQCGKANLVHEQEGQGKDGLVVV